MWLSTILHCCVLTTVTTAVHHLETYWAILEKVKASTLRLTKIDDEIYEHLCKDFPEFDPAEPINEDKMKSAEGKKRWRDFMMVYEKKVDDYSFGTILRKDPKEEYTQDGTIFGKCAEVVGPWFARLSLRAVRQYNMYFPHASRQLTDG